MIINITTPGTESPEIVYKEIVKYYDRFCRDRIPNYEQSVDNWCLEYVTKRLRQDGIRYQIVEDGNISTVIRLFPDEQRKKR